MRPPLLLVAALSATLALGQDPAKATEVHGTLSGVTRWTGSVRIVGDVTVVEDARLEIAAGTQIVVAEADQLQAGWNPQQVEIHVKGQLLVEGNETSPVVVLPEVTASEAVQWSGKPTWHGIVLHASADEARRRDIVRGARIEGAFAALQVPDGAPLIEDCVFRQCGVGIEVGSAYKDDRYHGLPAGRAAPTVQRCRFHACRTGVYASGRATPEVQRCIFHRCHCGVGVDRPGWTGFLEIPGSAVQRCLFVRCQLGIVGCSMTRLCVFERVGTILRLSDFHDGLATSIEHVTLEDCIENGSEHGVVGDSAAARSMLREPFVLQAAAQSLGEAWPALPKGLRIEPAAGLVDAANPLAAFGPAGLGDGDGPGQSIRWQGRALEQWMALPAEGGASWPKIGVPALGAAQGPCHWSLADREAEGPMRLRRVFGLLRTQGVLACCFQSPKADAAVLEVAGDIETLDVLINGTPAGEVRLRRRFAGKPLQVPIKLRRGPNAVVLRVNGWGADPRFAAALGGAWQQDPVGARPPKAVRCASAKGLRLRDALYVEIALEGPVHWAAPDDQPLARIRRLGRAEEAIAPTAVWVAPGRLRLGPLPADFTKSECEASFPALRDVLGGRLELPPQKVRIP